MKKKLFILVITFICEGVFSQSLPVFSSDGSQWTQWIGYWNGQFGNVYNHYYYVNYVIEGDTSVNGKTLQKFFTAGVASDHIDTLCKTFSGYFYKDSNKVYSGNHPDSLSLIYNYNLAKGDSFPIKGCYLNGGQFVYQTFYPKVDSITTIFYAGRNRRCIQFSLLPFSTQVTWLEGVGDINYGLVWSYSNIMIFNSFGTSLSGFGCFYDGGNQLSNGTCHYTNCTQNMIDKFDGKTNEVFVYPNPTSSIIFVECSGEVNSIILTDIMGRSMVCETKISWTKHLVDVSHLPEGVYFLEIHKPEGTISKKIIVQP